MSRKPLEFMGLSISNITNQEALEMIQSAGEGRHTMHFVNAHCINVAAKDAEYREILKAADALFADGSGIRLAGKLLDSPIVENVNGTDLFPLICTRFAESGKKLFLLGGGPEIAGKTADWVRAYTGSNIVVGTHHGFISSKEEEETVIHKIGDSDADLLLVAMGVPRQEKWIARLRDRLDVPLCMGVGGLFDFYSGTIRRAPLWMRKIGIEWIWRLLMEPRRMWRRYIVGNVIFVVKILSIRSRGRKGDHGL